MIVTNIKALQIALKALAPFCADDSNRYAIEGALIRGTVESVFVVATDGRKLAVAEIAECLNNEGENYILSAHTCEWITKLSPINSRLVLSSFDIKQIDTLTNDENCAKRNGSDGKTRLYIEGSFPPYADVIPAFKDEGAPTTLALEMLYELGALCKVVNKNRPKHERATMRIQTNGKSATLATCVGEFGTIYTVVIMPCHTEEREEYLKALRVKIDAERAELSKRKIVENQDDDSNDPTSCEYVAPGANFSPVQIEAMLSK